MMLYIHKKTVEFMPQSGFGSQSAGVSSAIFIVKPFLSIQLPERSGLFVL